MRRRRGVNPSLVPAAFFDVRSCSALTPGRGTDILHPWGHVEVPWTGSRAAHDVSWRSAGAAAGTRAFSKKNLYPEKEEAVGAAPVSLGPSCFVLGRSCLMRHPACGGWG